jgi:hypothetical protein
MGQGQGTLVIDSIDSCACHYSASFAVFTGAKVMVLAVFVGEAIAEAAVPFGFSFDAEISHLLSCLLFLGPSSRVSRVKGNGARPVKVRPES